MWYVYLVQNTLNDGIYVGKSKNPHSRWCRHQNCAKTNKFNYHFYNALRTYGIENFKFEVIVGFFEESDALNHERYLISEFRTSGRRVYNMTNGGEGVSGRSCSEYTKQLMSHKAKLRHASGWRRIMSQESKNRLRERLNSPEIKEKMRLSHLGHIHSSETIEKIRARSPRKPVVQLTLDGIEIANYSLIHEANKLTGVSVNGIRCCCNGRRKRAGNFRWHYACTQNE